MCTEYCDEIVIVILNNMCKYIRNPDNLRFVLLKNHVTHPALHFCRKKVTDLYNYLLFIAKSDICLNSLLKLINISLVSSNSVCVEIVFMIVLHTNNR